MRGNRLYQAQGKVHQVPSAQQLDISLLVGRCLNIGEASMEKDPAIETPSKWRASMRYPLTPAIKSDQNDIKPEMLCDVEHRGSESYCSFAREHQPPSRVQKIIVDLRAALSGVHEQCEPEEDVRDEYTVPKEADHLSSASPRNTLILNNYKNQQRAQTKILGPKPSPVSKRYWTKKDSLELWKIKMSLPRLVNPSSQREATSNHLNSTHNTKISLLQVTKHGILANTDYHFSPVRSQNNSFVTFPKIFQTNHLKSSLAVDGRTSKRASISSNPQVKRMEPSFIKSIEESTISVHQLLQQMRKQTSSVNHVLITEVLRSLREELWSMSEQPEHSLNDIRAQCIRRNVPHQRAENRAEAKATCTCQSSAQFEDKLPVRISLFINR
ncbi:uncharacterized protein LOC121287316 [Carcharodon carcharias]|uniref:uncharacterized protein LOC121287316 n=1 Tax=Carcharodon carcharias TaxID=13397 RepID=UPI001B7E0AB1|nr:uncharacterized protein LOC121287316 [Carcharodon carcharias]